MSNLGNKEIMAKNIKTYMEQKNVTRQDICDALGFKYSTFSEWVNGNAYPRIDKIEMMANYFGISKSDLVEDHGLINYAKEKPTQYYLDPETADFAQELKDRPELKMLFSASRKATKEDIEMTIDILNRLTGGQK